MFDDGPLLVLVGTADKEENDGDVVGAVLRFVDEGGDILFVCLPKVDLN